MSLFIISFDHFLSDLPIFFYCYLVDSADYCDFMVFLQLFVPFLFCYGLCMLFGMSDVRICPDTSGKHFGKIMLSATKDPHPLCLVVLTSLWQLWSSCDSLGCTSTPLLIVLLPTPLSLLPALEVKIQLSGWCTCCCSSSSS